jgi:hypothetical protein
MDAGTVFEALYASLPVRAGDVVDKGSDGV